jgi:hypothetical protein
MQAGLPGLPVPSTSVPRSGGRMWGNTWFSGPAVGIIISTLEPRAVKQGQTAAQTLLILVPQNKSHIPH